MSVTGQDAPTLREAVSSRTRSRHPALYEPMRFAYRVARSGQLTLRHATARWRVLPDFLIIGAQKAGTTSLFRYLLAQPQVIAPFRKEVHFFDREYRRGASRYRAYFPMRGQMGAGRITGEASPYYLFHPDIARRTHDLVPDARLIVLLRNPVQRAFSQYQHSVRKGFESGTFEAAIADEVRRLGEEEVRLTAEPAYRSAFHEQRCYVARGFYLTQLKRWTDRYGRDALHVVRSEDLFEDPATVYRGVLDFLGIDLHRMPKFDRYNSHSKVSALDPATAERLTELYVPHNAALEAWLGRSLGW